MTHTIERREFQAEVKQLLDLMVHSLYSNKDIFLRELISNSSDAIDKLRFEQLTRPELRTSSEPHIRIETDAEKRTISIIDNGIGMSREEVVAHLGTIAKSGTKEFLAAVKSSEKRELSPELIGQFGVGFYSSFMVADEVTVLTRRAGEEHATSWRSSGDGAYTLESSERDEFGTTVTLHLKAKDEDNGLRDYTDHWVIREIVKKYSDFVSYPIKTKRWKDKEGASGAKVLEEETLNSMKAIWMRPKSEVTDGEYREFYRHISHDWSEPLRHVALKIEGTFEAYALLYVPATAPYDLYSPEMKRGVQLYVKRVFVMDECKDLMPAYLRFVRGVVDAHDLSLNVSREILQKDRQIAAIRKQLVKKVLATLEELKKEDAEKYLSFWSELGPVLKEGLVPYDVGEKDKILELVLAASTHDATKLASLDDYVGRMKEGQTSIYYLSGTSIDTLRKSPLLEAYAAKGYEVLLFADPVDELWLERAPGFKDKKLESIARGEAKLGTEEEQKKAESELEQKQAEHRDLLTALRVALQEQVKEVRLSNRLTSSAVCLVGDVDDPSPQMLKILEQMGRDQPKPKRILELNPTHPLLGKLQVMFVENKADLRIAQYAQLLYGQAVLAESGQLPDPAAFNTLVAELMVRA
ncbi:molecular chaperone HtpG [Myxococcota bacterium]|nr:molecular chaperone HtpG [Myxococcota bacterium]